MIGMVLITHGRLAEELRSAMEHVVGTQRHVGTVCIGPEDDMERRRQELDQLEQDMPAPRNDDPLGRVFRRLDAIAQMVAGRAHRKGGCIIGNLSTALSDTHDGFRRRLTECFDEMAAGEARRACYENAHVPARPSEATSPDPLEPEW